MSFEFDQFLPKVPSYVKSYVNEEIVYRAVLEVSPHVDPRTIVVEIWTNQRDHRHAGGEWHGVQLPYRGFQADQLKVYGERCLMAGVGEFAFNFRAKRNLEYDWTIYQSPEKKSGYGVVDGPRGPDKISPMLQGPDYNHVVDRLSVGNEKAAAHAVELGFTHVLCVADELDRPFPEDNGVVFHKIPMAYGAETPLDGRDLAEAINWTRENWTGDNKILVYCKYGFMRAGSVALVFVLAHNPSMTYDEGLRQTTSKRLVIPHAGLKETVYRLYPRQ